MREVSDLSFGAEVHDSDLPVMVMFSATWCAPCRTLTPLVDGVALELAGRVKFVKADMDECPATANIVGVRSVPHFVVYKDGQKTAAASGMLSRMRLLQLLDM